jgi:hypothetical protein
MPPDFWEPFGIGLLGMVAIWLIVCYVGHGYCSTMLRINLFLFRHIRRTKEMHHSTSKRIEADILAELKAGFGISVEKEGSGAKTQTA